VTGLHIQLTGELRVEVDDRVLYASRLGGDRARLVFALVVLERGRLLTRDQLAEVVWEAVKAVCTELMGLEVSELIGAERGERRPQDRATHRNGYRARRWDTRAGEIELQIPKIRRGSAKATTLLEDAEADILAFYAFPTTHWRNLRSSNPLERFNREVGRRTDVVGIFPDDRSLIRLAGMHCIEQNDEWLSAAATSRPNRSLSCWQHRMTTQTRRRGGGPAPSGLSRQRLTDERRADFLHHVPGLDYPRRPGPVTFKSASSRASEPTGVPHEGPPTDRRTDGHHKRHIPMWPFRGSR
jgi:Transposase, Mutator family